MRNGRGPHGDWEIFANLRLTFVSSSAAGAVINLHISSAGAGWCRLGSGGDTLHRDGGCVKKIIGAEPRDNSDNGPGRGATQVITRRK